jgi:hypothetical protein
MMSSSRDEGIHVLSLYCLDYGNVIYVKFAIVISHENASNCIKIQARMMPLGNNFKMAPIPGGFFDIH